jgi:hypothetical protein
MPGQGFIASERDGGLEYIAALAAVRRRLWERALEHDKISPDTFAAVFSEDNPWVVFLNNCTNQYFEAVGSFACLGYTGLSMAGGRATLYEPKRAARKRP